MFVDTRSVLLDGIVVPLIVTPAIFVIVDPSACEVDPNVIAEFAKYELAIVAVLLSTPEPFTNTKPAVVSGVVTDPLSTTSPDFILKSLFTVAIIISF